MEFIKSVGPFGAVVFIFSIWLTYLFAPLSGSPFLLAGFYLFGSSVVFYHFIASIFAAITNFLVARIWGRSLVEKLAGTNNLEKIDNFTKDYGLRTLFVFRVFLGLFHDVISYAFGLTKVPFWPYLFASILGMIPGTAIWYYLSARINNALVFTVFTHIIAYLSLALYIIWIKMKKNEKRRSK